MKKSLISFLQTFAIGIVISILVMVFVGQTLIISGDSMLPTLENGERILMDKITYKTRNPKLGEIVVFRNPNNNGTLLIKRLAIINDGGYTVLGDNSKESWDSKQFGLIQRQDIIGKAMLVWWPVSKIRGL